MRPGYGGRSPRGSTRPSEHVRYSSARLPEAQTTTPTLEAGADARRRRAARRAIAGGRPSPAELAEDHPADAVVLADLGAANGRSSCRP